MDLSMPTIIGIITFLICSSALAYRSLYSKQVKNDINDGEKVNTASISIITIFLPFLLGRLSLEPEALSLLLDIARYIAGIGTPVIAFIAYLEYRSKVANKVDEKQLSKVLELLEDMNNCQFEVKAQPNKGHIFVDPNKRLTDLTYNFNYQEPNFFIYKNYHEFIVNKKFLDHLLKISDYCTDILIPPEIANELGKFVIRQVTYYKLKPENNYLEKPLESSYIQISQKSEKEEENTLQDMIRLSATYTYIFQAKESPYKSWTDFRIQLNILMKAIYKWLKKHNIEEINLPYLEKNNTKSKEN